MNEHFKQLTAAFVFHLICLYTPFLPHWRVFAYEISDFPTGRSLVRMEQAKNEQILVNCKLFTFLKWNEKW